MAKEKKSAQTSKILREFSSGGIVYKKIKNSDNVKVEIKWLVTKSHPSKDYPFDVWRLPKGWIDDTEHGVYPGPISSGQIKATEADLQKTAIREVQEEGGVDAEIISKVGNEMYVITSKLRKNKVLKFVTFYLMEWIRDLKEGFGDETSEIEWLSFEEARKRLSTGGERKMLDKAQTLIDSGIQSPLV
jgi:8-oxo-dGTP pyrophosphatase MutT (NUDIX family)